VYKNYKVMFVSVMFLLSILGISCFSNSAWANIWPASEPMALIQSACPAGQRQYPELVQLKAEISSANSLEQARQLALAPTDSALSALENARFIAPFSRDLLTASTKLSNARARILQAATPVQVANEFEGMMLAGLDNDKAAHVNIGSGGCDYSSGELIGIVVGLILGIIPGLILLVVLC
jgi:hypothetical protein